MIAYCFFEFGELYLRLSEYEKAQLFFEKALSTIQKLQNSSKHNFTKTDKFALSLFNFQNTQVKIYSVLGMGRIAFFLGDYVISQQHFEICLAFPSNNEDKAIAYWQLGVVKLIMGEEENSLIDFQESLKLFNLAGKKQHELLCSIMVSASQNQINLMLEQLEQFLNKEINITRFVVELRQILKLCEKYPDKPAFVELRKRLEIALNENKETPL